jgi:branched-chain amino acid transport system ATP-binding protein
MSIKSIHISILECRKVTVRFGGVVALNKVNFSVPAKSITSIIGPNGAGKTTLINAITGFVSCSEGSIYFNGQDISNNSSHERGRAGVVRTFQNLEIFSNMTVLENVMSGRHRLVNYSLFDCLFKTPRYWAEEKKCRQKAEELLDFVGLPDRWDVLAGELPFGSQRLLELARALASEPHLLLLDEPAAGLNIRETRQLAQLIQKIRDQLGITVALVEHDMDLVMSISDQVTVLSFGQVIATGTPLEVQKNPEVIAAYLGEENAYH